MIHPVVRWSNIYIDQYTVIHKTICESIGDKFGIAACHNQAVSFENISVKHMIEVTEKIPSFTKYVLLETALKVIGKKYKKYYLQNVCGMG